MQTRHSCCPFPAGDRLTSSEYIPSHTALPWRLIDPLCHASLTHRQAPLSSMPCRQPLRAVQARLTPSGGCKVPPPPPAAERWGKQPHEILVGSVSCTTHQFWSDVLSCCTVPAMVAFVTVKKLHCRASTWRSLPNEVQPQPRHKVKPHRRPCLEVSPPGVGTCMPATRGGRSTTAHLLTWQAQPVLWLAQPRSGREQRLPGCRCRHWCLMRMQQVQTPLCTEVL